jgi:hypothetical protein
VRNTSDEPSRTRALTRSPTCRDDTAPSAPEVYQSGCFLEADLSPGPAATQASGAQRPEVGGAQQGSAQPLIQFLHLVPVPPLQRTRAETEEATSVGGVPLFAEASDQTGKHTDSADRDLVNKKGRVSLWDFLGGAIKAIRKLAESSAFRKFFDLDRYGVPERRSQEDTGGGSTPTTEVIKGDICGPDVTSWLAGEYLRLKPYFTRLGAALATRAGTPSTAFVDALARVKSDPRMQGWLASLSAAERDHALTQLAWLAAAAIHPMICNPKNAWNFSRPPCPTNCAFSVTLCGLCFDTDVTGNILFFALGAEAGFPSDLLAAGARIFAGMSGGQEGKKDRLAGRMGSGMHTLAAKAGVTGNDAAARKKVEELLCKIVKVHVANNEAANKGRKEAGEETVDILRGCKKCWIPFEGKDSDRKKPAEWGWT